MNKAFSDTLERVHQLFRTCPDPNKQENEDGWSIKEVLGHLLDSLSNNHQRLARYNPQGDLAFPAYDQVIFVRRGNYRAFDFDSLLSLWYGYNKLLMHIVASIPPDEMGSTITVGSRPTVTIAQLVKDYFAHIEIHEKQVRRIIAA
ncbi:MAG: DinB family protein [Anaerolineae bacterium]|nr:DinB family protein [Anaerolineae bacterium]